MNTSNNNNVYVWYFDSLDGYHLYDGYKITVQDKLYKKKSDKCFKMLKGYIGNDKELVRYYNDFMGWCIQLTDFDLHYLKNIYLKCNI